MKVQTLRFVIASASFFLSTIIIVTDICLLSGYECFAGVGGTNAETIILSLRRLSFQEPYALKSLENHKYIGDLSSGLNQHVWDKNCLKTIESLCNFPIFPKAPDRRHVIHRTEITEKKDSTTDAHRIFGFVQPNLTGIARDFRRQRYFVEFPLEEEEAWSVVERYMDSLEKSYFGRYSLQSITRVEKKEDQQQGTRYFIEVIITDLLSGKKYNLAEYVFQPKGNNLPMCYPQGMQWNKTTDVYLILTAKNLGRWVHHFIKNMEKIVQETNDEHLHVIIYDFDSGDIDIKRAFQRSILKNYHYITKPGKYSRATSFKEAIESVKNPDSIVVTIDMHLDIGSQFIEEIRKHCIKGKTVYAPEIVLLKCGGSSSKPRGTWFHASYGTIATYKQDWDNFGGFSPAFLQKTTWGGEDWDLVDNAVKGGLEIERRRSPLVYHYYHVKAGMWKN
ncbi:beta-1,4-N-acetylgalactosaminyltransferase 3-like isoform X2 [Acropora muricata]|uniref:beta-1,4-N-acetylgalactosaminyltransferase 3-like isoform X2 n=1 Tax=Acropora muricata TaxID=159855 RepID=UPI0034E60FCB